jgi:predicted Zn-dependent protease
MGYENHTIPEGINVSRDHPLKEFFILAGTVIAAVVLVVFILSLLAEKLVLYIPFETEISLAEKFSVSQLIDTEKVTTETQQIKQWLQTFGEQLAAFGEVPKDYKLTFHYSSETTVNAFATIGGHIVVNCGLLKMMPDENALAMVLAHEIAHVKHRDPMVSLGRGLTITLALASLAGLSDTSAVSSLLGHTTTLTALSYNREMETLADNEALNILLKYYGHTNQADYLFKQMIKENDRLLFPEFMTTHPLDEKRIKRIDAFTKSHPQKDQKLQALPEWWPKVCS